MEKFGEQILFDENLGQILGQKRKQILLEAYFLGRYI